jgi:hypothetical protein
MDSQSGGLKSLTGQIDTPTVIHAVVIVVVVLIVYHFVFHR